MVRIQTGSVGSQLRNHPVWRRHRQVWGEPSFIPAALQAAIPAALLIISLYVKFSLLLK